MSLWIRLCNHAYAHTYPVGIVMLQLVSNPLEPWHCCGDSSGARGLGAKSTGAGGSNPVIVV